MVDSGISNKKTGGLGCIEGEKDGIQFFRELRYSYSTHTLLRLLMSSMSSFEYFFDTLHARGRSKTKKTLMLRGVDGMTGCPEGVEREKWMSLL